VAGASVHLVDGGLDQGPICAQEAFSIADCRTEDEVERRGLEVEHRIYPATLEWVLKEKFKIEKREGGRVCVRQS
jgi:phosphoribosylglycinamide formyltransferase-1